MDLSLIMLNILCTTLLPNFLILLNCSIPVIIMHLHAEWKTVWILIRWLRWEPANVVQHCFRIPTKRMVSDLDFQTLLMK